MTARTRSLVAQFIAGVLFTVGGRTLLAQDAIQSRAVPGSVIVNSAVAGGPPTSVSTSTALYRVKVATGTTKKITASINSALPAGVTMTINVVAPSGATSVGVVTLSTTPQTVVTNITNAAFSPDLTITYALSATTAAGVVASSNKTVTLSVIP